MRFARLRGLRGRLAVGTMSLLIVGIAVADVTAFAALNRQLQDRTDTLLQLTLNRGLAAAQAPGVDWNATRLDRTLPSDYYFSLYDSAGNLLIERLPDSFVPLPTVPAQSGLPAGATFLSSPGQQEGLTVMPRLLPASQQSTVIVNGQTHELGGATAGITNAADLATLRGLVIVQLWIALVIVVFALASTWAILRFGLRPLRDVADTAHEISAGDLSRRVPVTDGTTEIGAVSTALNAAFDHVEQSEHRMRMFVADASHELRTPLATIHGWADLYLHDGVREWAEVDVAMARIRLETSRMNDLVDQLLTLARLDVQPPTDLEQVDLTALCAEVIANLQVTAPGHLVELIEGEPLVVLGDEVSLRQVAVNLVSNSLRHTPDGTTTTVEVSQEPDESAVRLIVSDNGPGMTEEQLEHAFDRFWRANSGRGPSGGTGLGLAIVRASALANGGTVALESGVGEGLRVTVRLPARLHYP